MTSASTKRRKQRDVALLRKWSGTPIGTLVTVRRANEGTIRTVTLSEPFGLHAGAYVRVQGIDGNVHLRRVSSGWTDNPKTPLPSGLSSDVEIQRLRAAMVLAMDDAEAGAQETNSLTAKHALLTVARRLKTALEKK